MLLYALLLCPAGFVSAGQTVARRVLLLNFENSNKNANYDYLRESLADNLKTELIKTRKFTVLDERSLRQLKGDVPTTNLSVEQAAQLGLDANCEAVVVGRFMASARRIRISAEAIDALSARTVSAEKADGEITSRIFETIDQLVAAMVAGMQDKLPPLDAEMLRRDEALEQQLASADGTVVAASIAPDNRRKWSLGAAIGGALPTGYVSEFLTAGPSAEFYAGYRWKLLRPYASLGALLYAGKKNTIRSGAVMLGTLGLSHSLSLGRKLNLVPIAAFGMARSSFRSDYAAAELLAPLAQGGVLAVLNVSAPFYWVLGSKVSYIFDRPQPLLFTTIFIAGEYRL